MNNFLIKVLRKCGLLNKLMVKRKITLHNKTFIIPIINGEGLGNHQRISEPWMLEVLNCLIGNSTDDAIFIDVGVNLGHTLLKLKAINKSINYIGFEPNPICVNYVYKLIEANEFNKVEIVPVGISNRTEILPIKLFTNSLVDGSASIIDGFRDEQTVNRSVNVPVFKFADISLDLSSNVDLIKIDVEGGELEVVSELVEIIKDNRPYILLEVLPAYSSNNDFRLSRQNKIKEILDEIDYSIFRIETNNGYYGDLELVKDFGIHSNLNMRDYILSPSENNTALRKALNKVGG